MGKDDQWSTEAHGTMTAQHRGEAAEQLACDYLNQQGLSLLNRNFRSRYGEIDLIMQDKSTVVFVEVRLRKNTRFGSPAETVTEAKQRRISQTALCYLQKQQLLDKVHCRFDVVGIDGDDNIVWIKNAFEVQ